MNTAADIVKFWISGKYRLSQTTVDWAIANLAPIDGLADTYKALSYDLYNTTGFQLERVGILVGLERIGVAPLEDFWGWVDQSEYAKTWGEAPWFGASATEPERINDRIYRRAIIAKIIKNTSDGTINSSIAAATALLQQQAELKRDFSDFSMWFEYENELDLDTQTIIDNYDLFIYPTVAYFKGAHQRLYPQSVEITPRPTEVMAGDEVQFVATVFYNTGDVATTTTNPDLVRWQSSNANATIDENGLAKFTSMGDVTISAAVTDASSITDSVNIHIDEDTEKFWIVVGYGVFKGTNSVGVSTTERYQPSTDEIFGEFSSLTYPHDDTVTSQKEAFLWREIGTDRRMYFTATATDAKWRGWDGMTVTLSTSSDSIQQNLVFGSWYYAVEKGPDYPVYDFMMKNIGNRVDVELAQYTPTKIEMEHATLERIKQTKGRE